MAVPTMISSRGLTRGTMTGPAMIVSRDGDRRTGGHQFLRPPVAVAEVVEEEGDVVVREPGREAECHETCRDLGVGPLKGVARFGARKK